MQTIYNTITNNRFAYNILVVLIGLILDAIIGDPVFPLHPVRLMGKLAETLEKAMRTLFHCRIKPSISESGISSNLSHDHAQGYASREFIAGFLAWFFTAVPLSVLAWMIHRRLFHASILLVLVFDSFLIWASIARKDLEAHAMRVSKALYSDAPYAPVRGRQAVAMIVGRDVSKLDSSGVARACVESIAESSVDGVTAPLMFALIFGPWAGILYRAVNTMDSMFGHKSARYFWFGKPAARADDIANFLPARFSAVVACLCAPVVHGSITTSLKTLLTYRKAHLSPNAGHPESAYAGALGIWLGGTTYYADETVEKPVINPEGRDADIRDILRALRLLNAQTLCTVFSISLLLLIISIA